MPAVITIPIDPVLLRLGSFGIHWYGVAYVVAFAVGMRITSGFAKSRGFTEKQVSDLYWWNIGIGLLGGRLYYVVQQPNLGDYLRHPIEIIAVWKGGMAFFGALMACLLTSVVYAYRNRLSIWVVFDAGALFATLPQAIGRIGNIINGDILGDPSSLTWATRYTNPNSFAPHLGVAYQPAGAYELLGSLVLFAIVLLVLSRKPPVGPAGIVYLIGYPVSQLLLFFLRTTEPVLAFGLKQAQLTALAMLVLVVPVLIVLRRRYPGAFKARPEEDQTRVRPVVEAS
ncbi:MAG TPA: prolipoprotein diacylglyceryl transferase [Candidatus Dormibacteraeota bacterium]|nr:prolipoprotein diacylglyceryl transferase [Candidatus Dormibacteraeota bacterium]